MKGEAKERVDSAKVSFIDLLFRFVKAAILCLVLLSLAGYLGGVHWCFELMTHFKVQYLALLCLCSIATVIARHWLWLITGLLGVFINGIAVFPWYVSSTTNHALQPELRILFANVLTDNPHHEKLIELVKTEQPEILVLQEVDSHWMRSLESVGSSFPYRKSIPQNNNFGIAIFSRIPFDRSEVIHFYSSRVPSMLVVVSVRGRELSILATHPPPPVSGRISRKRDEQLRKVALYIRQLQTPKLIIGDLNTTMWSPAYKRLIRESGLKDARRGFGVLPTWPTSLPIMTIPIDHCLVSPDITVVDVRTSSSIGSDHLPVVVDLSF